MFATAKAMPFGDGDGEQSRILDSIDPSGGDRFLALGCEKQAKKRARGFKVQGGIYGRRGGGDREGIGGGAAGLRTGAPSRPKAADQPLLSVCPERALYLSNGFEAR
jgi:hypothetical protein